MKKKLSSALKATVGIFLLVAIVMHGEQLHKNILRSYVGRRTVKIVGDKGMGSGFFVQAPSGTTFILTNRHVCETTKKDKLKIIVQPSKEEFEARILEKGEMHDLCLIESPLDIEGLDLANSISEGESVGLIGHPQGWPLTLSRGEILGNTTIELASGSRDIMAEPDPDFCKDGRIVDAIFAEICVEEKTATQLFIYSRAGSSGSPLVNFYGSIVGVLFAGNRNDQFNSFAVPLYHIKYFLKGK